MKLSPVLLLSFTMLASCGATVKFEGAGGSSDDASSAGGFGNGDGGSSLDGGPTDGGFSNSVGGFGDGGGAVPEPWTDCYDDSSALYLPPDVFSGVETGQGACSSTQLADLFNACFGDGATQQSCDAFIAAAPENQGCYDCTLGSQDTPFPMPAMIFGNLSTYPTVYACTAHVLSLPECEVPVQSIVYCAFTACEQCDLDTDEWNECVNWSLNESSVCTEIELPVGCEAIFNVEALPAECIGDAVTLEEAFVVLGNFYCGSP